MAAAAEITTICVDTSLWMRSHPNCIAQFEAIKDYCEIKFKCNPKNLVGLFITGSTHFGFMLKPTRDLRKIMECLRGLHVRCCGEARFQEALRLACVEFHHHPPDFKKRILAFVGGPIELDYTLLKEIGMRLKRHVALDVVNFFVLKDTSRVDRDILYGRYYYAREELGELVTIVNDNDNSHIVDVDKSSVCEILSKVILKKNVRYLRKKDEKKRKENVSLKQEPEPVMDSNVKIQGGLSMCAKHHSPPWKVRPQGALYMRAKHHPLPPC